MKNNDKIIKLTDNNFEEALNKAASILKNDGIVIIPTETVYGIAASIKSSVAVKKIFMAKGRPKDNPLIVHISRYGQLLGITSDIPPVSRKLMETFWPGPLTVILKAGAGLNKDITAGLNTVAVRMPDNRFTLSLISMVGPIAAPSANISGRPSGTNISDIKDELYDQVDLIIDDGNVEFGLESTVIDATCLPPVILRKGSLSKEAIENVIGEVKLTTNSQDYRSPGMKYKHYAPVAETIFIKHVVNLDELDSFLKKLPKDKKIGVIYFGKQPIQHTEWVSIDLTNNYKTAARRLFATLRELDRTVDIIIVFPLPSSRNLWLSIEDRLEKGADRIIDMI